MMYESFSFLKVDGSDPDYDSRFPRLRRTGTRMLFFPGPVQVPFDHDILIKSPQGHIAQPQALIHAFGSRAPAHGNPVVAPEDFGRVKKTDLVDNAGRKR